MGGILEFLFLLEFLLVGVFSSLALQASIDPDRPWCNIPEITVLGEKKNADNGDGVR
jgi:hypothetical protein